MDWYAVKKINDKLNNQPTKSIELCVEWSRLPSHYSQIHSLCLSQADPFENDLY